MPRVVFTDQLKRFVDCSALQVSAGTVREALDEAFAVHPKLRGYILDDLGQVRRHVAIFVDGQSIRDRVQLGDPLTPSSEVYVMQALSGGSA